MINDPGCLFCKIVAGEIPSTKVYEDDQVYSFMDINPLGEGHLLIIPKNHYSTIFDIPPEDLGAVFEAARKISLALKSALDMPGLNLIQSNGRAASQIIDHFHLHLIPRKPGDAFSKIMEWRLEPGDMDEIGRVAEKITAGF
jgi:histidine triad (HIT) family protein